MDETAWPEATEPFIPGVRARTGLAWEPCPPSAKPAQENPETPEASLSPGPCLPIAMETWARVTDGGPLFLDPSKLECAVSWE